MAGLGEREAALAAAQRATELLPIPRDAIVGSVLVLDRFFTQLRVGAPDEAVRTLDTYLSNPSAWSLEALLLDPRLDALRDRAEFVRVVQRHGRK